MEPGPKPGPVFLVPGPGPGPTFQSPGPGPGLPPVVPGPGPKVGPGCPSLPGRQIQVPVPVAHPCSTYTRLSLTPEIQVRAFFGPAQCQGASRHAEFYPPPP